MAFLVDAELAHRVPRSPQRKGPAARASKYLRPTLDLDPDTHTKLQLLAEQEGRTRTEYLRVLAQLLLGKKPPRAAQQRKAARFTFPTEEALWDQLEALAAKQGTTITELLSTAITQAAGDDTTYKRPNAKEARKRVEDRTKRP